MTHTMIDEQIAGVSVEQAVCQIAQFTDLDSLVMTMDWLTCHNENLRQTTHENLADYAADLGRFTGSRRFHSALTLSMPGTDSPQETLLRLRILDAGLPCPQVNYEISDPLARCIHTVDMAYPSKQIAIEYDGAYHYTMERWDYDIHKRNRLADMGWKVFTATKTDFKSPSATAAFIRMIGNALSHRQCRLAMY